MQAKILALVSALLAVASPGAASPVPQTCPVDCWAQYWQCVANNIPEPTCRVQLKECQAGIC